MTDNGANSDGLRGEEMSEDAQERFAEIEKAGGDDIDITALMDAYLINENTMADHADETAGLRSGEERGVGDEMEDGTIFAGYYEGKPLYATPRDAPGIYAFNEAARYAKTLDAHGHPDFRVPNQGELNVLWENRNKGKLKGTFNETDSYSAGWYRSSTERNFHGAWDQRFSDGKQGWCKSTDALSLRCIR